MNYTVASNLPKYKASEDEGDQRKDGSM